MNMLNATITWNLVHCLQTPPNMYKTRTPIRPTSQVVLNKQTKFAYDAVTSTSINIDVLPCAGGGVSCGDGLGRHGLHCFGKDYQPDCNTAGATDSGALCQGKQEGSLLGRHTGVWGEHVLGVHAKLLGHN